MSCIAFKLLGIAMMLLSAAVIVVFIIVAWNWLHEVFILPV